MTNQPKTVTVKMTAEEIRMTKKALDMLRNSHFEEAAKMEDENGQVKEIHATKYEYLKQLTMVNDDIFSKLNIAENEINQPS